MSNELALFGTDLFGEAIQQKSSGPVAERFTFPPFSILDARQGDWRERKRAWLSLGIQSELGRDAGLTYDTALMGVNGGWGNNPSGTSVFDPVLCELAYRWWSPEGGQVVDPFAGGSVRGVVAASLGRRYWGCDLRAEQVNANREQAHAIELDPAPEWVVGDSMETLEHAPDADFVFSCPPYGNLEVYSKDERDISNMEHHTFVAAYKRIILRAVKRMKPDTFACFVVGDFRDTRGFYRNFVAETVDGFHAAGAMLYNEAILVTPAGTAPLRVTKQFNAGRKLAKTHQNVLVFVKGDWKKAAAKIGAHQ